MYELRQPDYLIREEILREVEREREQGKQILPKAYCRMTWKIYHEPTVEVAAKKQLASIREPPVGNQEGGRHQARCFRQPSNRPPSTTEQRPCQVLPNPDQSLHGGPRDFPDSCFRQVTPCTL